MYGGSEYYMTLEKSLLQLEDTRSKILKQIDKRNQNRKILCASCKKLHRIGSLDAIQTHWYTSPYGCTGGGYWNTGEIQFICPKTKRRNRLLFLSVNWENKGSISTDPQEQFRVNYSKLFKSIIDEHGEYKLPTGGVTYEFDNNDYIDKNRKKFGLTEGK